MEYESVEKKLLVLILLCLAGYFNINNWHSLFLGLLVLFFYLWVLSGLARQALIKFFGFSHTAFRVRLQAAFLALSTLGCIAGAFIVFYRLAAEHMALAMFLNGLLYLFIGEWAGKAKNAEAEMFNEKFDVLEEVPQPKIGVLLVIILSLVGFCLLFVSRSAGRLATPWQAIGTDYIYVFGAAVILTGLLIFSKLKTKIVLFLLVLVTLLLHSYLPLTHKLIYGADGWRHMAVESAVLNERKADIVVFGADDSVIQKINPGRFSYSQLWGISTVISRLLNIPLLAVNKWLLPVVWSLVFPLLMYEIGIALGWTKKESLLFSWVGLLPFAWQAAGSFTLPVNLGFLVMLFCIVLILHRLKLARKEQAALLAIILVLSFFNYILYLLFIALAWILAELINKYGHSAGNKFYKIICLLGVSVFVPAVELLFGYSKFDPGLNWTGQIKQLLGNFSAYYLSAGSRPHDITTGNIIFNQTPAYAFVANFFTQWRWWLIIFSLALLIAAVAGIVSLLRRREPENAWLGIFCAGVLGSYVLSNYFLAGEHLLARRMDNLAALAIVVPAFYFLITFIFKRFSGIWTSVIFVAVVSVAIIASYSLGPDAQTATENEYNASSYVWQAEKYSRQPCVLGDTYFLLALEAVSSKKIIGGGFPIDQNFGQAERVQLYDRMNTRITSANWADALRLAGANHCWLVISTDALKKQGLLNGAGYKLFGDLAVLKYN
jgi:hypothetical protein